MARNYKILWADDEIEYLKPHLLFLEERGYEVTPVVSGNDALELLEKAPDRWDIVMLDQNMPGVSGMETLQKLRRINSSVPVVMITKSEEEELIDRAVGNQINDYLIKPVNPRQILHSLKKLLESRRLVSEQASTNYRREYLDLSDNISTADTFDKWVSVYRSLVLRSIDFQNSNQDIAELLNMQHDEAQREFCKFINKNYHKWFEKPSSAPLMSHTILRSELIPELRKNGCAIALLFDNFRADQWISVKDELLTHFTLSDARYYCALLPTATQYARNALLSGLLPESIAKKFPWLWVDEDSQESKNANEEPLLRSLLDSEGLEGTALLYRKANTSAQLAGIIKELGSMDNLGNRLVVIVVNFLDVMSHSKTDSAMMKELAPNDSAYRSITLSWFRNSPVADLLATASRFGCSVFLTTDHGSILAKKPVKITGDKETNTALRYKLGKNLFYPPKEVMSVVKPSSIGLPAPNLSTTYIFALNNDYFIYPNDFNHYAAMFRDTYQHGGISMEEMIVPWIKLNAR